MVDLVTKSPADGLVPINIGRVTLTEVAYEAITSVAPFSQLTATVSAALDSAIGIGLPATGRVNSKGKTRVAWASRTEFFVLGASDLDIPGTAVVDQSDAWAVLGIEGAQAAEVLARLTPLDLRASVFPVGCAARSYLGHMTSLFLRTDEQRFEILVFRSMAGTAVHELAQAMTGVAARATL